MRQHTRGRIRRIGMAMGAAAVVTVGLQATSAAPAHAECWSPVNISCVEDGGFDSGDGQFGQGSRHAGLVGYDVDQLVMQKLNDFDCSRLLAGGLIITGAASPLAVYEGATVVSSSTPKAGEPTALAGVDNVGAGSNGTITLYPKHFTETPDNVFQYLPPGTGLSRLPSKEEFQASTVLHEDAHLMGTLGAHTPQQSAAFDLEILSTCFGITKIN